MKLRSLLLGACALGLAGGAVVLARAKPPAPIVQPIPFNHEKHLTGKDSPKLGCPECHTGAETGSSAGLPSLDQCLQCHMKPQSKSDHEKLVRQIAARGGDFRWAPVTSNPKHVYVSHRAHVTLAKLSCAGCHGDVKSWDAPPAAPNRALMSMDLCLDCHRKNGAPTACHTCHR